MRNSISRKHFLTGSLMALSGMAVAGNTMVGDVLREESISHSKRRRMPESDKLKICIFSKHLQRLNYNDMASLAAEIGFKGIDLTVRPGGMYFLKGSMKIAQSCRGGGKSRFKTLYDDY